MRPRERNGALEMDAELVGVVFYESDLVDGRRWLRCHGQRSIYDRALTSIRQWH
jgi:hypothetical protein